MTRFMHGLRVLLHLLGRSARASRGQGQIVLQPYRGFGTGDEVYLVGRAFKQPGALSSSQGLWADLRNLMLLFRRRSIANAALVARCNGAEERVTTDRDGYFRIHIRPGEPPPADHHWHEVVLALSDYSETRATGRAFVPPPTCRFVVISDIDDTITETGVANKAVMLWRLFLRGAESRTAFPGVAALLRAFHRGCSGSEMNPMLYVSRAPWSIYEVLEAFFHLHRIPVGPVMFLREWGMTWESPLPRRSKGHKLELIRDMLKLYDELPFVLIGDSGQRDPEIYTQIVREHPQRVLAIYIRNVSHDPNRLRAIENLALQVVEAGSTLLLASDSMAMARHAAEHDLIAPRALADVQGDENQLNGGPTREVGAPSSPMTKDAVQNGTLAEALEQGAGAPPANVEVEAGDAGTSPADDPRHRQR